MDGNTPGFPVLHHLPELAQTHAYWVHDAIQLSHPILLLHSIFPRIRVFSIESVLCIRWPNYWSFSFSISPSNEYSELISFRMDWFGLLPVQGKEQESFQHHSSKASILQHSAFFIVQLSYPYMTTGKTIALSRQNLDLKTYFRSTDWESFTKISQVIHLYTKIWMGVFFLSYTIESSGEYYSKRCLRHSHSDNLYNFESNNQVI